MNLFIRDTGLTLLNMATRMPFRYGIAEMTRLPHAFLRLRVSIDGTDVEGIAAEHLPPKWFTKNPDASFETEIADMLAVLQHAARIARGLSGHDVFDLWRQIYARQRQWAAGTTYPPLLSTLGVTLVERALIDAWCRASGQSFAQALRGQSFGIQLGTLHPEMDGIPAQDFLPEAPLRRIVARHTVGLGDPLTDADIPAADRLDDGLPQSLEACIAVYGLKHFKIKLCGDPAIDRDRLRRLAALLDAGAPADYAFTLDGNEQYRSVAPFRALWTELAADPDLAPFLAHLLFVEQPLHRDVALDEATGAALLAWPDRPPLIIDESDCELTSLRTALDRGYIGTSHKNCKGVFKSIANRCYLEYLHQESPATPYHMSGEDLSNVGPIALLQDLAVAASLGIASVERNGHHYFRGLSMLPADLQATVLDAHGDLYRRHPDGYPTLNLNAGELAIDSVIDAPFGYDFPFDPSRFVPAADWRYDSLPS